MKRTVHRFTPHGTVHMRPSKSILHRALICAALADGASDIMNFAVSDDISATMDALEALGLCRFEPAGSVCRVCGLDEPRQQTTINCRESGSTLRFLLPVSCDGQRHVFTGRGRLMSRPMGPYEEVFSQQHILFDRQEDAIVVDGALKPGRFVLDGNISSQFVTGLLFALPLLGEDSLIEMRTPLESAPYVDLTREVMEDFGVVTEEEGNSYRVPGRQAYRPRTYVVEGDYSHAAFFAVAAALAGQVQLTGLHPASSQGDRLVLDVLRQAGAKISWEGENLQVTKSEIRPFSVDVAQIPDLVPALTAFAAGAAGRSELRNAGRLRMKESDRLEALEKEFRALGGRVYQEGDTLVIEGTGSLEGGEASAHGDHRIAMALAAAALISRMPVTIDGAEAVSKSAPQFFHEWAALRGDRA